MNKVFLVGRLTAAPEQRVTPNGVSVTTFSIAVTRRMNREETDFLNIVTWRGLAENCAKYLEKGQQVAVAGEIRTRSYEAKDGTRRYVTEIQAEDVEFLARGGQRTEREQSRNDDDDLIDIESLEDEELPF